MMSDIAPITTARYAPQLQTVVDMTRRTIKANTPLFMLVSYQHNNDKHYFIDQLGKALPENNLTMSCYDPKNNSLHTSIYPLMATDAQKQRLSIVQSMPEDERFALDMDFVTNINFYRDLISKDNLHWILFVKAHQMGDFIDGAPDLWSFRIETLYLERDVEDSYGESESGEFGKPKADLALLWRNVDVSFGQSNLTDEIKVEVVEHISNSRALIAQSVDELDKVRQLVNLTDWLYRKRAYDLTIEVAMEAVTLLDSVKNNLLAEHRDQINEFYHQLNLCIAYSYSHKGNRSDAIDYFNRCLPFVNELTKAHIKLMQQLAFCYGELGNYDLALKKAQLATNQSEQAGFDEMLANSFYVLAVTHRKMKHYDLATKYHQQSLLKAEQIGDKELQVRNYGGLANVYQRDEKYKEAIEYHKKSLDYYRQSGNKLNETVGLNNIGVTLYLQQEYEKAQSYLLQAKDLATSINNIQNIAGANYYLALICYQLAEYPAALDYAKQALPLLSQLTSPEVEDTENLIKELEQKLSSEPSLN